MTRQQVLSESIRDSRPLLERFLKGFDDSNHTKQAPGLPNHIAWTLGHLAWAMNRIGGRIDGKPPLPEADFHTGDGTSGNRDRFDSESIGFNSKPVAEASLYPSFARCVAIFEASVERLASAVANASDATLDAPTKWAKVDVPAWTLAPRMVFHNGTHCGQIVDLRRALGMGTILG